MAIGALSISDSKSRRSPDDDLWCVGAFKNDSIAGVSNIKAIDDLAKSVPTHIHGTLLAEGHNLGKILLA
jgi:hypothetical protein